MAKRRNTDDLLTEAVNPRTVNIDLCSTRDILSIISAEDSILPGAVAWEIPNIETAVDLVVATLRKGGRLFFIGAGASGRLGVMEAAECPPTFGTPPELIQGIIAGGPEALTRSVEGAEDSRDKGREELETKGLSKKDVVVGIAASAGTPFVEGALEYASKIGAATILLTCTPPKESLQQSPADIVVTILVEPEVIVGSTRMKAGTATKMALNMITTASMIKLGKTYGNLMVEVQPASDKLKRRQERIVMRIAEVDEKRAKSLLKEGDFDVKTAVLIAVFGVGAEEAGKLLRKHKGFLRKALEAPKK